MTKRVIFAGMLCAVAWMLSTGEQAEAANPGQPADWHRFYHYPYVYYPHNFQHKPQQYNSMYYKYPTERRIPVFNKNWHNFYLMPRKYHKGFHYQLDTF